MKILYAAGNRLGSFYQLKRFLESVQGKHTVKVAAYKISMGNLDIDYNLDSLLNFTNPKNISFNGNYTYYHNEVKKFGPDLIISDMEIYSSILANELNIKLWQVSPVNLYHALENDVKNKISIYKNYSYLLESNHKRSEYINYILNNSDRKFVLSHLCDSPNRPRLINGYEWARPSFILGEGANNATTVIVLAKNNKNIINDFKDKNSILFSPFFYEKYNKIIMEDIDSNIYRNSFENCEKYITDGTASFLADGFYNEKYCFSVPRYDDIETIIGSYMNEYCGIGKMSISGIQSLIDINIDDNTKFISEYLE